MDLTCMQVEYMQALHADIPQLTVRASLCFSSS